MLYLNTRHRLPTISIHQTWGQLNRSSVIPAQVHGNNEQAQSNKGATQSVTEINEYPSRRAYGARNMGDFTREHGQKGISDARASVSDRTQRAWSFVDEGAKRGNDITQKYKSDVMAKYSTARIMFSLELPNAPTITVTPSQVVGDSDQGNVTAEIETSPSADVAGTPGSAETQLVDKGFIRNWVTEGHYDIYA